MNRKEQMKIKTVYENKRGCGFRKPGGIYLRTDSISADCGLFPVPLVNCSRCGSGIKPARGFTWIDADLITSGKCKREPIDCVGCGLDKMVFIRLRDNRLTGRCGLIWIGEKYYLSPQKFLNECNSMGVSRRIKTVPNGFKIGITPIFVAHRKCIRRIDNGQMHIEGDFIPGVFQVFVPDRIEYVVKGSETEKELEDLLKRGFVLVDVKPIDQDPKLGF